MPNYSRKNRNAILHASPQSSGHRQVNISTRIAEQWSTSAISQGFPRELGSPYTGGVYGAGMLVVWFVGPS